MTETYHYDAKTGWAIREGHPLRLGEV